MCVYVAVSVHEFVENNQYRLQVPSKIGKESILNDCS